MKTVHVIIQRQDNPQSESYSEEFIVPYRPSLNVVAVLLEIQKNPVTKDGKKTTPVIWECNCLEEVCGACMMLIDGKARQACSALIDQLPQPIRLAPADKFPVIRDLMINRSIMFENLKKVKAWVEVDGSFDIGSGPRVAQKIQEEAYELSRCMTCGCCMHSCPNFNSKSDFIGPAPMAQAHLFNLHPTGALQKEERLNALMQKGGIASCGNSQNCVQACPKKIPLTTTFAKLNRQVNKLAVSQLFSK
jgi:succinate dehydrogenase / fumarate reductase iron-sulfur subunit